MAGAIRQNIDQRSHLARAGRVAPEAAGAAFATNTRLVVNTKKTVNIATNTNNWIVTNVTIKKLIEINQISVKVRSATLVDNVERKIANNTYIYHLFCNPLRSSVLRVLRL